MMQSLRHADQSEQGTTLNHHPAEAIDAEIRAIQQWLKRDRRHGLAQLNDLFRTGMPPDPPLQGQYHGQLVALELAPGLTQLVEALTAAWLPWQGKTFDAARTRGDNIFTRDSLLLAHLYWPFYRHYVDDGPHTYRAFVFRTYVAPGLADPDRQVLKIDYNLPENPGWSIRRILDELVQVAPGLYLGKAHFKWWWGKWQLVAYFSLTGSKGAGVSSILPH